MAINCRITPEVKSKLLTLVKLYLDSHSNTNPQTLCQDIIKDIWNNSDFSNQNSDERYFLKNALSLIPFIVKNNILTKNAKGEFAAEGITQEHYNRFDKQSVDDLIKKFSYVKKDRNDREADWLKNISELVGDLRGQYGKQANRDENIIKKQDEINREEEIIKMLTYNESLEKVPTVNNKSITSGDKILIISKEGKLISSTCVDVKDGKIYIPGSEEDIADLKQAQTTSFPIHDDIDNIINTDMDLDKRMLQEGEIYSVVYNAKEDSYDIKCGNKLFARFKKDDSFNEYTYNMLKLGTLGDNQMFFKVNDKNELESFVPDYILDYGSKPKLQSKNDITKKSEKLEVRENPNTVDISEVKTDIMVLTEQLISIFERGNSVVKLNNEQLRTRENFTRNIGNIKNENGENIEVFLKGETREIPGINKKVAVLVACDKRGNTLYFKPKEGNFVASTSESFKNENNIVLFNIDPITTSQKGIKGTYGSSNRFSENKKSELNKYINERNVTDEKLRSNIIDYINTLNMICKQIVSSDKPIIFEITNHIVTTVTNNYFESGSREVTNSEEIIYDEKTHIAHASVDGRQVSLYNSRRDKQDLMKGIFKLVAEEITSGKGFNKKKTSPSERQSVLDFIFKGGIYINGDRYQILPNGDSFALCKVNKDGSIENVVVKYNSDNSVSIINDSELEVVRKALLEDNDNYGFSLVKFRLNKLKPKEGRPFINSDGSVEYKQCTVQEYFKFLGMRVVNPGNINDVDCNVSFKLLGTQEEEISQEVAQKIDDQIKKEIQEQQKVDHVVNEDSDKKINIEDNPLLSNKEDEDLFKSLETKLSNEQATKEQIEQAKEWFKNSPLAKTIGFSEAFNMVHSKAVAKWTLNGIVLMNGSDYTDLYHESWHAFAQTFLTKEEKRELYNSLRNKKGTFTDEHNNTVKFSEASYKQLEEYLAEGFRTYMLNRQSHKESGIVLRVFKKIWNILKSLFSKTNTVNDLYEKLAIGDIAKWTQDRGNVMFDELHRSIDLINKDEGSMSSKRTYDISELMNIYMSDYLTLDKTRESFDFRYLPYLNKKFNDITKLTTEGKLNDKTTKESELLRIDDEIIKEIAKDFNISEDEAKQNFKNISIIFGNTTKESVQSDFNVSAASEFFTSETRVRNAYMYSLSRLMKLRNDLAKKIQSAKSNDDTFEEIKLNEQFETVDLAIKNFGEVSKFNNPVQNRGVISFHFKETFSEIKMHDDSGEEDPNNSKEMDADEIETSDPDTTNENRGNAQSAEQRMKNDALMKFLLSTIPSFTSKVNYTAEKEQFSFSADYNEYGERKVKDFKKIKNRLTTLLQGCPDVTTAYNRIRQLAYKEDGKTIKDPIMAAILNRLGNPDKIVNEQDKIMQQKALLWNKFWQVFACPEVPLYEVDINVTKSTDDKGKEIIENVRTNVGEMSGPKWKMNDYYRGNLRKSGAPLYFSPKGYAIDFDKLHEKYNPSYKDINGLLKDLDDRFKINQKDKEDEIVPNEECYGLIYELLHDLGISISPDKNCIDDILYEFDNDSKGLVKSLIGIIEGQYIYQNNTGKENPITDPVTQLFGYEADNSAFFMLERIKKIDMKYTENINTEMVRNAEGSVLFMNQLNNSITQLLNKLNDGTIENYEQLLNTPSLKHLDIREFIEVNGEYVVNPNYNPDIEGSSILNSIFKFETDELENKEVTLLNGKKITRNIVIIKESESKRNKKQNGLRVKLVNLSGVKSKTKIKINENTEVDGPEVASSLFQADKNTKALSDLILFTKGDGLMEFMRHADKGVSYAFRFTNPEGMNVALYNGNNTVIQMNDDSALRTKIEDNFIPQLFGYLEGELRRVSRILQLKELAENKKDFQYDYKYLNSKDVLKLGVFDDMLSSETKETLKKITEDMAKSGLDYDKFLSDETVDNIKNEIFNYYKKALEENINVFKSALSNLDKDARNSILKELFIKQYTSFEFNRLKGKDYGFNSVEIRKEDGTIVQGKATFSKDFVDFALYNILNAFTSSNIIYNIECAKLIYGNVMIYNHSKDDFTKRIGGMGSTGSIFNDDTWMRMVLNKMAETSYSKQLAKNENVEYVEKYRNGEHEGELKTAICADIHPLSAYAEEYEKAGISTKYRRIEEEGNAQGLISFDSYRYMCMREGKWDEHKEELFQKICKISTGESNDTISNEDVVKYFPILKLQFEGPLNSDYMPLQAFHKYALMPIIPTMIKDKNLELVHKKMMQEGIDYITYNSASKLSTISNGKKSLDSGGDKNQYGDQLYKVNEVSGEYERGKDGKGARLVNEGITSSTEDYFTPNYIPIAYIKDQVEIHDELDEDVIFSTQMRRLMNNNFYEDGVPMDFKNSEENIGKSIESIQEEWSKLSNEQKLKKSELYRLDKNYTDAINKLTQIAIEDIKKEFGMNKKGYFNASKFLKYIKKELNKKGVPEYVTDNINDLKQLQFGNYAKEVEKIIISLINKRVIKQHVHGGQFVQVASTLFETQDSKLEDGEEIDETNDLSFYGIGSKKVWKKDKISVIGYDKEGNPLPGIEPATIKIPLAGDFVNLLQSKVFDSEGNELDSRVETLENLNKMLRNQAWVDKYKDAISIVSCRIPVQGHNSIESYRIAEFLAPGCNNIIVCPSELVIKSGGDYDVDKLSTILPHIRIVNGEVFIPGAVEETQKEQYDKFIKERDTQRKVVSEKRSDYYWKVKDKLQKIEQLGDPDYSDYQDKAISILDKIDRLELSIGEVKTKMNSDLTSKKDKIKLQEQLNKLYGELDKIYMEEVPVSFKERYEEQNKGSIVKDERGHVSFAGANESLNKYKEELSKLKELEKSSYSKMELNDSQFGYENVLLKSMIEILKHEVNTKTLLTPNQTDAFLNKAKTEEEKSPADILMANATYNRFHRKNNEAEDTNKKNMSPTRIIEYQYNLEKHDDLNTGKTILGPAAIDNVFAPISKKAGIKLSYMSSKPFDIHILEDGITISENDWSRIESGDFFGNTEESYAEHIIKAHKEEFDLTHEDATPEEKASLKKQCEAIANYMRQEIFLPHNTIKDSKGRDVINLSHATDKMNENEISELIAEYMNGCVDVAKDAWIKYVQGNREAIPTFMFMIQSGIPVKYACYFISNPAIVEYIKMKTSDKSAMENMNPKEMSNKELKHRAEILGISTQEYKGDKIINLTSDILRTRINDKIRRTNLSGSSIFTDLSKLKERALSKNATKEDKEIVAAHFFMIEDMASAMNALKLGIRVDASKSNTVYDLMSRQSKLLDIAENERLDTSSLDNIIQESVLSSFFIEDFAMDLIKQTLPIYSDETLTTIFEQDIAANLAGQGLDMARLHDNFYNQFKSYLYQMAIKTFSDDSFVTNERMKLVRRLEPMSASSALTSNKICKLLDEEIGSTNGSIQKRIEEVRNSKAFKEFLVVNSEDEEADISDDVILENFIIPNKLMNFCYTKSAFENEIFNVCSKYAVVKSMLEKDSATSKLLAGYTILDKFVAEKRDKYNLLLLDREIDDKSKEILYEEYQRLMSNTDEFSLQNILNKSDFSEYDKQFIMDFFRSLPNISIAESGMSTGRGSMNMLFDSSSFVYNEFVNFKNLSDSEQLSLVLSFSSEFKNRESRHDQNNSFDSFVLKIADGTMKIQHDGFVDMSKPKSPKDFVDNSGGAYGADHFGGEIGKEYGIGTQRHYLAPSKNLSGGTVRSYGENNTNEIIESENYNSIEGKEGVLLIKMPESKLQFAEGVYKVLKIKNGEYPVSPRKSDEENNHSKNLVLRNYYQVANSTGVYCFSEILPNKKGIKDGGTSWAEELTRKTRNVDGTFKKLFVFDASKNQWFEYDYIDQIYKECDTPVLTRNFAIIGTRSSEIYSKKVSETEWADTDAEYTYETRCAMRDLYENTFGISSKEKPLHETVTSRDFMNMTRKRVQNSPEVLYIYNHTKYVDKDGKMKKSDLENFVSDENAEIIKQMLESGKYRKIVIDINEYENVSTNISKTSINEVKQIEQQQPCTQINIENNKVEIGDVVEYNGSKYLLWNINNNGLAQLMDMNLTKFSGTPKIDKLKHVKKSRSVIYNETKYFVTKDNKIISSKTGNVVHQEESVNRNKILANLEVQEKKAVVIKYKDSKYVVNDKNDIISVTTGKKMNWSEENGDRKSILELAKTEFDKINGVTQEEVKNEEPTEKQLYLDLKEESEDKSKDVVEVKAFEYKNTPEESYISDSEGKRYKVEKNNDSAYDINSEVIHIDEDCSSLEKILDDDVLKKLRDNNVSIKQIDEKYNTEWKERLIALTNMFLMKGKVMEMQDGQAKIDLFVQAHIDAFKKLGINTDSSFTQQELEDIEEIEKFYTESFGKEFHFNEEQKRAIIDQSDFIISKLSNKYEDRTQYSAITGQAGTGKTTVAKAVIMRIERYLGEFKKGDIIMGATAGKATNVLKSSMKGSKLYNIAKFLNVASMTGKVPSNDLGDRKFVKGPNSDKNLAGAKLIIIDECSMVSDEDLNDILDNKPEGAVLMFLGDVGQLPPVSDKKSNEDEDIEKSKLSSAFTKATKINSLLKRERQGEGNPLLDYSDEFYLDVDNKHKPGKGMSIRQRNNISTEGAIAFTGGSFTKNDGFKNINKYLMKNIILAYRNAVLTHNPSYIQYISYTKASSELWNKMIHEILFNEDREFKFHAGEPIIFTEPYVISTDSEDGKKETSTKIEKSVIDVIEGFGNTDKYHFNSQIQTRDDSTENIVIDIDYQEVYLSNGDVILVPVDIESWNKKASEIIKIYENAIKYAMSKGRTKTAENLVNEFNNNIGFKFAGIQLAYGLNVHQSQGSTYDIAIVDEGNINNMKFAEDRNGKRLVSDEDITRAKYTALTRSRNIVISLGKYQNNETNDIDINMLNRTINSVKNKETDSESAAEFYANSSQMLYGDDNGILDVSEEELQAEKEKC